MSSRCAVCGCDVDPTLDPARVLDGGHIATLCRRCIKETREIDEVAQAALSDTRVFDCGCGSRIELWRAVTAVREDMVTLACPACAAGTNEITEAITVANANATETPTAITAATATGSPAMELAPLAMAAARGEHERAVTSLRPQRRPMRTAAIVAAVAMTGGMAVYSQQGSAKATAPVATTAATSPGTTATPTPSFEPIAQPQATTPSVTDLALGVATTRARETATLDAEDPNRWVYPLPGLPEKWQTTRLGTFGSRRDGRRPRECRRGHCGVDLHGPRGMPIVAVLGGIVDRVHASRRGKGGRYIELLHDDGARTYYMHLDHVRRSLRVGTEVVAGEALGTLGRSGIRTSPAHLHFAWKLDTLRKNGKRGLYRNPASNLSNARVIQTSDVRGVQELPKRRTKKTKRKPRRRPRS